MFAKLKVHGRFWLTLDGANFLGGGRIELLERIDQTGSISQAAKSMKMSYKAAWDAVDAVNRAWGTPLVESKPVGSALTEDAKKLIAAFHQAQEKHRDFLAGLEETLPVNRAHKVGT